MDLTKVKLLGGVFRKPEVHFRKHSKGFALIATISILVLLALISVGLLSLSTITIRSSRGGGEMSVARSNARLGIMIALNQLQETMGPDQRVTAPADLQNPNANNPKWIGVYGNEEVADYSQKPSEIPSEPYKPVLLNWLVSGNHDVSFGASTSSGDFGKITSPPTAIPFAPTDSATFSDSPTIKSQDAALLVSSGSTSSSSGYVSAPIVPVNDDSGNVRGGYAYWTADEGMKARINLRENFRQQTDSDKVEDGKIYSFMTSQRSGIEMMSRDATASETIAEDYNPESADIDKLISTGQLSLLSNGIESSGVLKNRFHDVTAYSRSVLSDSYAGGLKQDMSAAIYGGFGPADSEPIFTPESNGEFGLPTWGHIRSWAKFTAPLTVPPPEAPSTRPYTSTQTRFGPVISGASLGFGFQQNRRQKEQVRVQLFPALMLWNPYTVAIPADNYEVGFGFRPSSVDSDKVELRIVRDGGSPNGDNFGDFYLSGGDSGLNPGNGYFRFRVNGSVIPPGETHVYLASSGSLYVPGDSALVRAPEREPVGFNTRYFVTARTFELTGGDLNPDVRFEASFGGAQGMSGGDLREVILTEPNGLAGGFSNTTPVYQAILDLNTYQYVFPPPDNENKKKLATLGFEPSFVFRTPLIMEARGINADWRRVGAMHRSGARRGQERNRWIANHNPLAPYIKRSATESTLNNGAFSHGSIVTANASEKGYAMTGVNNLNNYLAGVGTNQGSKVAGPLIDVLPSSSMLLSLGQLQHAQFDAYGFGTTYTFGNSGARVSIGRDQHYGSSRVARPGANPTNYQDPIYDVSWHVNRALWDRYFVSTSTQLLTQNEIDENLPLPNARMTFHKPNGVTPTVTDLRSDSSEAFEEAAANLMVAGGFNVNSTSVEAWRAVLTGTNQLSAPSELANPIYARQPLNAMIPRFSRDVRATDDQSADGLLNMWDSNNGTRYNIYRGNRELVLFREQGKGNESPDDAQERLRSVANALATKIVDEVRLRGPFLSLGDFVNRDLTADDQGIRGALQAAIDKTNRSSVNPRGSFAQAGAFVNDQNINFTEIRGWNAEHYMGTPVSETGSPSNSRTAMAPKHLTQADLLSTIGPALSARSDTFVIRSYGESINPSTNEVTARAWCEAVVQRTPDYVDATDKASTGPAGLTQEINKVMGRRFEIVSFRWLSSDEV